jgi:hypothetical protein
MVSTLYGKSMCHSWKLKRKIIPNEMHVLCISSLKYAPLLKYIYFTLVNKILYVNLTTIRKQARFNDK